MAIFLKSSQAFVTAARAVANFSANGNAPAQSIADESASIILFLEQLNTMAAAGGIAAIMATDTRPLSLTYPRHVANAQVLGMLGAGQALTVSGVPVAGLAAIQADTRVKSFTVADGAGAIAGALDALNAAARLTAITLTSGDRLTLSVTRLANDAAVLGKIASPYTLTVTSVTVAALEQVRANPRVSAIQIIDTAAAVAAAFPALNAMPSISAIGLSGGNALALALPVFWDNQTMVSRLDPGIVLTVTGVSTPAGALMQANARVNAFAVIDTAPNVQANLEVLNGQNKLSAITVTGQTPLYLTHARYLADQAAVGKLAAGTLVNVLGVPASAAAAVQADSHVTSFWVTDTLPGIAARLDALNASGKLMAIELSEGGILPITYSQWINDTAALNKLPAGYAVSLSGVTAAGAASARDNTHVRAFTVSDTAASLVTFFDTLNGMGKLTAITVTNAAPIVLTNARHAAASALLSKIVSDYMVTVLDTTAAGATIFQNAAHVAAFTVTDAAPNVMANLAALNAATRLSAVTLTDGSALTLTYEQMLASTALLAKLPANYIMTVVGVTVAGMAAVRANSHVTSFTITDRTAAIAAVFDTLGGDAKLTRVTFSDQMILTLTAAQFNAGLAAIAKLPGGQILTVSGASVSAAMSLEGNARVQSFTVRDTGASVAANLGMLNAATKLRAIVLTDTAPLVLTQAQLAVSTALLAKLPANQSLIVRYATAAEAGAWQNRAAVKSFTIADMAARVGAALDTLNGYTKLTAISLSDALPLALTFSQYSNDTIALSKIGGAWMATVSGVSAARASAVQGDAHVQTFTVRDSAAAVLATLDALNGDGKLTAIALTGDAALTLPVWQLNANAAALNKITSPYRVTVTGVTVAELNAAHANSNVTEIQIADTAANVLNALGVLSADRLVTFISLSTGPKLSLSWTQFASNGAALAKLAAFSVLIVNGVSAANAAAAQAAERISYFNVTDTAATIATSLDALNGDGKLVSITLSGGGTALSLPYAKFLADGVALGKIAGAWTLTVTAVPAAGASAVAANPHATPFTVTDTLANVGARLDQLEALAKAGKLTSIAVSDSGGALTLTPAQYTADAEAIALMKGAFTINQSSGAASGATINLIWEGAALAAPAAFRSAVTYTAQYFQSLIVNPITINLRVGYGEVAGSSLGSGVLGAAGPDRGIGRGYAQFRNDLMTHDTSAATHAIVNSLPVADPFNGATIYLGSAEAKALGLMAARDTAIDGSMGFAADPNGTLWAYDPSNRAIPGRYDLIGVVQHELSHALGRIAIGGTYGNWIGALDVFRYAAPGVHSPNAGGSAYFSIDGGTTNLNWFSTSSDLGDWASTAVADANAAYSGSGTTNRFTQADIAQLNALGFATTGTVAAVAAGQGTAGQDAAGQGAASASGGLNAASLSFAGTPTIAFMNEEAPIFDASIRPPEGIEQIAQFVYGVNQLRIDLLGLDPAAFRAFDTSVEGQHAIALTSQSDTAHGIVLTRMADTSTAADLMAHHLSFREGHAIIA